MGNVGKTNRTVSGCIESGEPNACALVAEGLKAIQRRDFRSGIECFRNALQISPDNSDAGYNLALAYLNNNELTQALTQLRRLAKLHPAKAELHNDLGVVWQMLDKPSRALASFRRALKINVNYGAARNNAFECCLTTQRFDIGRRLVAFQRQHGNLTAISQAEVDHWEKVLAELENSIMAEQHSSSSVYIEPQEVSRPISGHRIAFFASHKAFINDITAELGRHNEVRVFDGSTLKQMNELMVWSELSWFEWCDDQVIQATRLPKQCPIVCRLHSYEAFTDMPSRVDWSKVDHLIFVNRSVMNLTQSQIRPPVPSSIIANGVDMDRFQIPTRKMPGKKIASVGYINYKKNPTLLLYCFKKIHDHDPGYTLHIAGEHQDSRIQLYFDHFLKKNPLPVRFDGWVEDMPSWYADKDFVISTSLFESFHYSIAEGMCCGVLPLIHDWYGADGLYPEQYLFSDPDDCLNLVRRLERSKRPALAESNRQYIESRYSLRDRLADISRLLGKVMRRNAAKVATA
ncbi:MAG TPA: tetratricopeptide repeat protein [Candidatus Acidoferrum sp.]|nr:tetratricopeptide repeat protein [Candidatus Acidoferrum sp.]